VPATCESVPALAHTHLCRTQLCSVKAYVLRSQRCCVLAQASPVQLTFGSSYAAVLGPPPRLGGLLKREGSFVGRAKGGREAELQELVALHHSVIARALRAGGLQRSTYQPLPQPARRTAQVVRAHPAGQPRCQS